MAVTQDLVFVKGKTFNLPVRWEVEPIIYKPITGIAQSAPVRITCPAHGLKDGWRVAVVSVKGMTQINAQTPPRDRDFKPVTVFDANTIDINEINAAEFKAYVTGGYLQFNTPADLTGVTARMSIKDKVDGTVLLSLTTANSGIVIDTANKVIYIKVSATATAALTWKKGYYDLEMVAPGDIVTGIMKGVVTVEPEITT